ncbi:hypothetical protein BSIN_4569 [Burkholderia singularis]|uniref:Uncharacterized protein n=1 Tax=Burkholderia singularis TaxID=1503053 RepID=A0A238HCI6_9BURK|nr:hypothetical protein BSIN_4569 [Burkholderia singularis]
MIFIGHAAHTRPATADTKLAVDTAPVIGQSKAKSAARQVLTDCLATAMARSRSGRLDPVRHRACRKHLARESKPNRIHARDIRLSKSMADPALRISNRQRAKKRAPPTFPPAGPTHVREISRRRQVRSYPSVACPPTKHFCYSIHGVQHRSPPQLAYR